jgi:hypothetical protein
MNWEISERYSEPPRWLFSDGAVCALGSIVLLPSSQTW